MLYQDITNELLILENSIKAKVLAGFFKTWPGQYGEWDRFLGITISVTRKIVKEYVYQVTLFDIEQLLLSPWHEIRLAGVLFLVQKFQKGDQIEQEDIFHFYLKHTKYINNWDLVDTSALHIIGAYLFDKKRDILKSLAQSDSLWERRIAIIATFFFIRKGEYMTTFSIIEILLWDTNDLIHKANGWMLREIGKHCGENILEGFLYIYYQKIPRTTLRYAIERLDTKRRKNWLQGP